MPTIASPSSDSSPFNAEWLAQASTGLEHDGCKLLARAAQWVSLPLEGLVAKTGEPMAEHSAAVVRILAELGTDAATRASALITVLPVAAGVTGAAASQEALRKQFG